ncbi:MAG TPA: hypothetical protein DIW17_11965, partial [Clostridiales bacterium]|nr:hypothetical protein [Clostridiales bacterium]
ETSKTYLKGGRAMIEDAVKIITETKNSLIEKYEMKKITTTRNNVIWGTEKVVLIQNMTTGELKLKKNLR